MSDMTAIKLARAEYWSKGYTVLRGIFGELDVERWRTAASRLWTLPGISDDLNLRAEFRKDTGGRFVLDRLDPVLDLAPELAAATLDDRLLAPLSQILGGASQLLKCKLIRKDPATGGYAPHQDFLYWRWLDMDPRLLCSVAIPLHASTVENGGIEFFPKRHDRIIPSADGDPEKDCDIASIDVVTGETPSLEPGDVCVFHSLTPHRSGPNLGSHPRTLLLPSYALTDDTSLYLRYYAREIPRRGREAIGFERILNLQDSPLRLT